jgi:hypothetical protein
MVTIEDRDKDKEGKIDKTHKLLKILPILPIETPVNPPYPIPSGVMPRPGREEDDGIVGLN